MTMLVMSIILVGCSMISTWLPSKAIPNGMIDSATAKNLPLRLGSDEATGSLFYRVMKSRGPQPGGALVAKPLDSTRGPEARSTRQTSGEIPRQQVPERALCRPQRNEGGVVPNFLK